MVKFETGSSIRTASVCACAMQACLKVPLRRFHTIFGHAGSNGDVRFGLAKYVDIM